MTDITTPATPIKSRTSSTTAESKLQSFTFAEQTSFDTLRFQYLKGRGLPAEQQVLTSQHIWILIAVHCRNYRGGSIHPPTKYLT